MIRRFWVVLGMAAIYIGFLHHAAVESKDAYCDLPGNDSSVARVVSFALDPERGLNFRIPLGADGLKVSSNAHLKYSFSGDPSTLRTYGYSIKFQFLDDNLKPLSQENGGEEEYVYSSESHFFFDTNSKLKPPKYFQKDARMILSDDSTLLNLASAPKNARYVHLALGNQDPDIQGIMIETFARTQTPERRASLLWNRIHPEHRKKIMERVASSGQVFGEAEAAEITETLWRPMVPAGVINRDYSTLQVCRVDTPDRASLRTRLSPPPGVVVRANKKTIFRVRQTGDYILSFQEYARNTPVHSQAKNAKFKMEIYENDSETVTHKSFALTDQASKKTMHFEKGYLEITSETDGVLHLDLSDRAPEIPLAQRAISAFEVPDHTTLNYPLFSHVKTPSVYKVDVRALLTQKNSTLQDLAIHYALLDSSGKTLSQGDLKSGKDFSGDIAELRQGTLDVNAPVSYFMTIPPEAKTLSFSRRWRPDATSVPIVTVFNRPADLGFQRRLPAGIEQDVPLWFYEPPTNPEVCEGIATPGTCQISIRLNDKPPEDKDDFFSGYYTWNQLVPIGNPNGNSFIVKKNPKIVYREESRNASFTELNPDTETEFLISKINIFPPLEPQLLRVGKTLENRQNLSLALDGHTIFENPIQRAFQNFSLNPLDLRNKSGRHKLRVTSAKSDRIFANFAYQDDIPTTHVLRQVYPLSEAHPTLAYDFTKVQSGPLSILVALYVEKPGTETRLQVTVESNHPRNSNSFQLFPAWSPKVAVYDIYPSETTDGIVIGDNPKALTGVHYLELKIGDQIPVGTGKISFSWLNGTNAFVSVSDIDLGANDLSRTLPDGTDNSQSFNTGF